MLAYLCGVGSKDCRVITGLVEAGRATRVNPGHAVCNSNSGEDSEIDPSVLVRCYRLRQENILFAAIVIIHREGWNPRAWHPSHASN
jgi:hypothetical protein